MSGRLLALLLSALSLALPCPAGPGQTGADPLAEPGEPDEAEEADESEESEEAADPSAADASPPAAAQPRQTVSLLVVETFDRGVGVDQATRATELLKRALLKLEHIEVLGIQELQKLHAEVPAEVSLQLARADTFVRKGRESLFNLSLDDATEAFQTARVTYRRQLSWMEDPERLVHALMGLAESLAAAGDRQAAGLAYREVLAFSPEYEPDPGQVPSKLRVLFEEVRAETRKEPGGNLSIQVEPAGAEVILDGLTVGRTPLVRGRVPAGLHMLRVHREGFDSLRRVIEVKAGETGELVGRLERLRVPELIRALRSALAGEPGARDPVQVAVELARLASLPAVLLSQLAKPTGQPDPVLSLALVPAQGKPCVLAARLVPDQPEQVAGALAWQISEALEEGSPPLPPPASLGLDFTAALLGRPAQLAAPTVVRLPVEPGLDLGQERYPGPPSGSGPETPQPDGAQTSLWGRWWFWTAVGAVVVGGLATGLALGLGPQQQTLYDPDQVRIRMFYNPNP